MGSLVTNLLGLRCKAIARPGWISDGGSPQSCAGIIEAIAYERDFVFLVVDDGNTVHRVQTITHEIHLLA